MAQSIAALFRPLITALPGSGGTPSISGRSHPRWGFVYALEKQPIAAGLRRDRSAHAMAVSRSCGGLPGGAQGRGKKGGKDRRRDGATTARAGSWGVRGLAYVP